jgi:ribosome biogenesis protein BRX1
LVLVVRILQAKSPDGPTVKFLVLNVHTMDELKLTGNHLKGSR